MHFVSVGSSEDTDRRDRSGGACWRFVAVIGFPSWRFAGGNRKHGTDGKARCSLVHRAFLPTSAHHEDRQNLWCGGVVPQGLGGCQEHGWCRSESWPLHFGEPPATVLRVGRCRSECCSGGSPRDIVGLFGCGLTDGIRTQASRRPVRYVRTTAVWGANSYPALSTMSKAGSRQPCSLRMRRASLGVYWTLSSAEA